MTIKRSSNTEALAAALRVLTTTPAILAWLRANDPKALEQAQHALAERDAGLEDALFFVEGTPGRITTGHGSRIFLRGGYTVEVISKHREWTDRAVAMLELHDELVAALRELANAVVEHVPAIPAEQSFRMGAAARGSLLCHAANARAALAKVEG